MSIDNLEEMIVRQLSNNLTEQEAKELLNWYNASEDNRKLYRDYCVLLKAQSVALDKRLFEKDNMRSWKRVKRRIQQRKISVFWLPVLRYASVAVVALLIGVGLHMFFILRIPSQVAVCRSQCRQVLNPKSCCPTGRPYG